MPRARSPKLVLAAVLLIGGLIVLVGPSTDAQEPTLTFAAIGDYGIDGPNHTAVAEMVDRWNPDLVITAGDNRYGNDTYDSVIGRRWCDYLSGAAPGPTCDGGGAVNRFFPSLGNHDYSDGGGLTEYLDYFALPGNERYYDYVRGSVHFFAVDSGPWGGIEPDQLAWLQAGLESSSAPWQVVYFHHAAFSSAEHGSNANMQHDYAGWGADLVIAGHDHHYERIEQDGIVYIVNGIGGNGRYGIGTPIPGSIYSQNSRYGAMKVTASASEMTLEFLAVDGGAGEVLDRYTLTSGPPPPNGQQVTVSVAAGGDDIEERAADGVIYTDSSDLELVDDSDYQGQQVVGLRFQGVDVPPDATVTGAKLVFTADESDDVRTDLVLRAEATGDAAAFTTVPGSLTARPTTVASVTWIDIEPWTTGARYDTPDLTPIVQEVIDRADWQSGNDLAVVITGTGERTAESFNGQANAAPRLVIDYRTDGPTTTTVPTTTGTTTTTLPTTPTTPTTTATTQPSTTSPPTTPTTTTPTTTPEPSRRLTLRPTAGRDDVEEAVPSGSIYRNSSDLELTEDRTDRGLQLVAIRFPGASIPRGATITAATLRFVADESDDVRTDLVVRGHDAGAGAVLTTVDGHVSGLPLTTAAMAWNDVEPWVAGGTYESPDLRAVIQEVVDRGDWSGRAITLVVSGTGERTAEAHEGGRSRSARLIIDYTPAQSTTTTVPQTTTTTTTPTTTTTATTTTPTTTTTTTPTTTTTTTTVTQPPTTTPTTTTTTSSTTTSQPPAPVVVEVPVAWWSDDVEERTGDGFVYRPSSDIELVDDPQYNGDQVVGLRFQSVPVPAGATIERAEIRFTADESSGEATTIDFAGHAVGDAPPFTATAGDVSQRPLTSAEVRWAGVPAWTQGQRYLTPDLGPIVQELVDRADWTTGNDIAVVVSGSGRRVAESYDGSRAEAPRLIVTYTATDADAG